MKIKIYGVILATLLFAYFALTFHFYKSYVQNIEKKMDQSIFYSFLNLNNKIYDSLFKKKENLDTNNFSSFLIAIDEESVQEIGRWPWSREVIAKITQNALNYGVKSIGFDIIFSESENEKTDDILKNVFVTNSDKVILGTFSDNKVTSYSRPYQDYCYNEAFLKNGGEHLVKLKFDLIVDDDNIQYEELNLKKPFNRIFDLIERETDFYYTQKYNKQNISDLSIYQKNNLKIDKIKRIYDYCGTWLTENDSYLQQHAIILSDDYNKSFNKISIFNNLNFESKINLFKNSINKLIIPQYLIWVPNIKNLQENMLYTASFVADMDLDGVIRKYPLIYRTGNKLGSSYIPSLALQTYLTATGYQAYFKLKTLNNEKFVDTVVIKDVSSEVEKTIMHLPVDRNGRLTINYYGAKQSLPHVSARELFHDELKEITVHTRQGPKTVSKETFFKNKAALFGATATAIYDIRNTPVDTILPGPEIHLSVLENLFKNDFVNKYKKEDFITYSLALLTIVSFTILFLYTNLLISSIYLFSYNYVLFEITRYYFKLGIQFQYISIIFLFSLIVYFVFLVYIYFFETRKSQQIKNTFSKYVSKEIVNEILKNQDNLQLKGQKLNMTVFFSDIRGFTDFSEKMDPQELSLMLNKYFTPMSETIFSVDGTVDKFMGDAIMALFGAPINYPDHAQKACRAALQCLSHLEKLNLDFKNRNWPEIQIGIGINTGTMVAGNIGSDQIQSYTVIGDEVNLASRLEGLNKNYGSKVLISESTYLSVRSSFITQEADLVRVKGKTKPVKIYSLISEIQHIHDENLLIFIDEYHKALETYKNRDFKKSYELFLNLSQKYPDNILCQLYLTRSENMIANPPAESWDGVFEYKNK